MSDLTAVIRAIIAEELRNLRAGSSAPTTPPTEEVVSITSSADLNAFARRVLEMEQDGRLRGEVMSGDYVFTLSLNGARPLQAHVPLAPVALPPAVVKFTKRLISERDLTGIPNGTKKLMISKQVRFTPLARDEISRRGIQIERSAT